MSEKRFTAKVLETIPSQPRCWDRKLIGVFDGDTKICEYRRNYESFGASTFYAFEQNGQWFALYSPQYTATRLMRLPECVDIGGEEPHEHGFCPVELYVPKIVWQKGTKTDPRPYNPRHDPQRWARKEGNRYYWPDGGEFKEACDKFDAERELWYERHPFVEEYATFGFVAGCYWGDDSSWKVEYLDLSRASEGILIREPRFGYCELPPRVSLADAIDCSRINEEGDDEIYIAVPKGFKLSETVKDE